MVEDPIHSFRINFPAGVNPLVGFVHLGNCSADQYHWQFHGFAVPDDERGPLQQHYHVQSKLHIPCLHIHHYAMGVIRSGMPAPNDTGLPPG